MILERGSKLVTDLIAVIDSCSTMGVDKVVVPLVDNGRIEDEMEENRLLEQLKKLSKYLRERRVHLIFETDFSPLKNKEFICKLPNDIFGINYDNGNSASLGLSVTKEFELFSDRIKNIHIKDRKFNGGTVPLGTGSVDFKEFLGA